jgi:diguanylate cyclase (GGDEF)-like protein
MKNPILTDKYFFGVIKNESYDLPQRKRALKFFLSIAMLIFFSYSLVNATVFHLKALASVEFAIGLLCVGLYRLLKNPHYYPLIARFLVAISGMALWLIILTLETEHSTLMWIGIFPIVAFYLLGLRNGLIAHILFSLVIFFALMLGYHNARYAITAIDLTNILGTLIAYGLFIFLYEYSRDEALHHVFAHSIIDELTEVGTRKLFEMMLKKEKAQAQRRNHPLALILIDIDHFKKINDTYGHMVGDAVLHAFASLLENHIREGDTLTRWGGEEFAIILPQSDRAQGVLLANKLRSVIEEHTFHDIKKLTASFGVTHVFPEESDDATMHRVDSALYRAKANGRNRVETA